VLLNLLERAPAASGVRDLGQTSARLRPQVHCTPALLCLSSGIVDQHPHMLFLQGDINAGGTLVCGAVDSPVRSGDGFRRETAGNSATEIRPFRRQQAGLNAVLLRYIDGYRGPIPTMHLARGNYFTVAARSPFRHLIYPVPHAAGLGIHATLDLGKRVRFGPDVEWIDRIDYSVNAARAPSFYAAIRHYWPGLADGALMPDYGVSKLHGPGTAAGLSHRNGDRPRAQRPREPARHREPRSHVSTRHR
jgi:L-2-hydroxyglutarate oxidase LhgO